MPVERKHTQHIEYLPYGECFFERRDIWNTPYKFNAKELDEETGLYYYGARYYTPEVSIWLSVDPYAHLYSMLSPYSYCANNPIVYTDLDGNIIALVVTSLANSPGAGRAGHMAIIVGNDDIGYHIFSLELPGNSYIKKNEIISRGSVDFPWSLVSGDYVLYSHKEESLEELLDYMSKNAPGANRKNGNGYDRILALNNISAEDEKGFLEYMQNRSANDDFLYKFPSNNCSSYSMNMINNYFGSKISDNTKLDIPNSEFNQISGDKINWTVIKDAKNPSTEQFDFKINKPLLLGTEGYGN